MPHYSLKIYLKIRKQSVLIKMKLQLINLSSYLIICLICTCTTNLAYSQYLFHDVDPLSLNTNPVDVCNIIYSVDEKDNLRCKQALVKFLYFDGRATGICLAYNESIDCLIAIGNRHYYDFEIKECYTKRRSVYSIFNCLTREGRDYKTYIKNFPAGLDYLKEPYNYFINPATNDNISKSLRNRNFSSKFSSDIATIINRDDRETVLSTLKELNSPEIIYLNEPRVFFAKGLIFSYLGDNLSALENLDQSIKYISKDSTLRVAAVIRKRGDINKSLERYEEAVADYMQVYGTDPEKYEDVLNLIVDIKIERLDQKDSACSLLRSASQRGVDVFEAIRKYCN